MASFCSNCGTRMDPVAAFCSSCGTKRFGSTATPVHSNRRGGGGGGGRGGTRRGGGVGGGGGFTGGGGAFTGGRGRVARARGRPSNGPRTQLASPPVRRGPPRSGVARRRRSISAGSVPPSSAPSNRYENKRGVRPSNPPKSSAARGGGRGAAQHAPHSPSDKGNNQLMRDIQSPSLQGILFKQGAKDPLKRWKKRLFLFSSRSPTIYYFTKRADPEDFKGSIALDRDTFVISVNQLSKSVTAEKGPKFAKTGFAIYKQNEPRREYFLYANGEADRSRWMNAISAYLREQFGSRPRPRAPSMAHGKSASQGGRGSPSSSPMVDPSVAAKGASAAKGKLLGAAKRAKTNLPKPDGPPQFGSPGVSRSRSPNNAPRASPKHTVENPVEKMSAAATGKLLKMGKSLREKANDGMEAVPGRLDTAKGAAMSPKDAVGAKNRREAEKARKKRLNAIAGNKRM